jgi:hypothetical protein
MANSRKTGEWRQFVVISNEFHAKFQLFAEQFTSHD